MVTVAVSKTVNVIGGVLCCPPPSVLIIPVGIIVCSVVRASSSDSVGQWLCSEQFLTFFKFVVCDLLILLFSWVDGNLLVLKQKIIFEEPVPYLVGLVVDGNLLVPSQKIPFGEPVPYLDEWLAVILRPKNQLRAVQFHGLTLSMKSYFLLLNSVWKFNYNLSKIMYESF